MNQLLKEYYWVASLDESEISKYYLICKYKDKVSQRLLQEKESLLKKGEISFRDKMHYVLNRPNPFFSLLKKQQDFSGSYVPVPIHFGKS